MAIAAFNFSVKGKGVPMRQGPDVHTPEQPYCDDLACPCHTDVEYHGLVTRLTDDVDTDAYEYAAHLLEYLIERLFLS